jgi:ADP-ribosyl-[dinitrogen reductase] hydrolase
MKSSDIRLTSITRPYNLTNMFVVDSSGGKVSTGMAPGKIDERSNRDLELDLEVIKQNGIQIIVCLLEWQELHKLHISEYPKVVQENGYIFYHFPIKDCDIPKETELIALIKILRNHLMNGYQILIHCREGLGRAGTICACCLVSLGYHYQSAISMIRQSRPKAIQNFGQEKCVENYYRLTNEHLV